MYLVKNSGTPLQRPSKPVLKKASCLFQHRHKDKRDFSFACRFKHSSCFKFPISPYIALYRFLSLFIAFYQYRAAKKLGFSTAIY